MELSNLENSSKAAAVEVDDASKYYDISTVASAIPARERDYLSNVRRSGEIAEQSIKSKTKPTVWYTAKPSQVEVPLQI
jgi:hypothetical protein